MSKEVYSSKFESEAVNLLLKQASSEPLKVEPEPEEMANLRSRALRDVQVSEVVRDTYHKSKSLRGKSAKAIEYQLQTNATLNLSNSEELAEVRKFQREAAHLLHDEAERQVVMEDRLRNLADLERITEPLIALSREMRNYESKSTAYFMDKRSGSIGGDLRLCVVVFLALSTTNFPITPHPLLLRVSDFNGRAFCLASRLASRSSS